MPIPSLIGWAGARGGMHEVYYFGPLAIAPGSEDVGVWVGCLTTLGIALWGGLMVASP